MDQSRIEESLKVFQRIYKSNNPTMGCAFSINNLDCQAEQEVISYPTLGKMRRKFCPFPKKIGFFFSKWEFFSQMDKIFSAFLAVYQCM